MVDWKNSTDKNGNEYFYYPAQEEIFKKVTAENEGFILDIYDSANNKLKRKEVNSGSKEWRSPVFGYLKTMQEDGKKYYELYNNCKFYAVPKSLVDILDSVNNGAVDLSRLINDYVAHKNSSEYSEKYKWEFIEKFAYVFEDLSDIELFKNNLLTLFKNCNKTNLATKELMTQSRMFVSIVEEYPEEFRMAFWGLFDENASIDKRVDDFTIKINELREKIQWSWKITSSTAAFFLFVKDSNKYPCFSAVTRFHKYFELINYREYLQYKSKSIGLRYKALVDYIHDELIPTMNRILNNTNTAIDAQDFIWYVGNLYLFEKDGNKKQLKDLTWWEISALGMYLNNKELEYKENDVKNTPFVQYAMEIKNNYKPSIGTELRECSNDETTDYKRKNEYFIRLDNNYYKLNENGIEYIETELKHFLDFDLSANEEVEVKGDKGMSSSVPLNQILYGPPGTGKTYNTATEALKILEPDFVSTDRNKIMEKYNFYRDNNQIQFITFHQAYSYEEFVEGIRPDLTEGVKELKYKRHDGIFKKIVNLAQSEYTKAQVQENINLSDINIFKMSLGNTLEKSEVNIYDYCIENECIALGYGENEDFTDAKTKEAIENVFKNSEKLKGKSAFTIDAVDRFKNWMKINDLVFISNGNTDIRAIGKIVGDYYFKDDAEISFKQFRNVKWLYVGNNIPFNKFSVKNLSQQSIYQFYKADLKFDFINNLLTNDEKTEIKKYVLVIDEINRGEISKIFGELITLIEDTKRTDKENLQLILPYSGEPFSLPSNLYIIGTMNTADRSIALLDVALRRRFDFIPKYPDSNVIGADGAQTEVGGVDLKAFLDSINERIEVLLDKDHTIGHSYLMGINSYEEFLYKFKNRILPLLQEYFYNDYEKIAKVLNQAEIDNDEWKDIDSQIILKLSSIDDLPKYSINEKYPQKAFLKACE